MPRAPENQRASVAVVQGSDEGHDGWCQANVLHDPQQKRREDTWKGSAKVEEERCSRLVTEGSTEHRFFDIHQLASIERPGRKPRCVGEVHSARNGSTWGRMAFANNHLSALVMLSGRMSWGVQYPPRSVSVPETAFCRNTMSERLNSG